MPFVLSASHFYLEPKECLCLDRFDKRIDDLLSRTPVAINRLGFGWYRQISQRAFDETGIRSNQCVPTCLNQLYPFGFVAQGYTGFTVEIRLLLNQSTFNLCNSLKFEVTTKST